MIIITVVSSFLLLYSNTYLFIIRPGKKAGSDSKFFTTNRKG